MKSLCIRLWSYLMPFFSSSSFDTGLNSHQGATNPRGFLPVSSVIRAMDLSITASSCSGVIAIGFSWL